MEEQEPFFPPSFIEELKRVFKIFLMALAMPFPYPKPDVKSWWCTALQSHLLLRRLCAQRSVLIDFPQSWSDFLTSDL